MKATLPQRTRSAGLRKLVDLAIFMIQYDFHNSHICVAASIKTLCHPQIFFRPPVSRVKPSIKSRKFPPPDDLLYSGSIRADCGPFRRPPNRSNGELGRAKGTGLRLRVIPGGLEISPRILATKKCLFQIFEIGGSTRQLTPDLFVAAVYEQDRTFVVIAQQAVTKSKKKSFSASYP